jgi:phosphinothricin acetyltransferase
MKIRSLEKEHYRQVAAIYAEGLATGIASFETQIPDWKQWDEKFLAVCRYVAMVEDEVVAWCALSAVSKRAVYKGVAEDTIYVASKFQKRGIGKKLLQHLIDESEKAGFWTLQAGIFPENESSIQLHEKCGFRRIGFREKIAQRNGKWHDNVLLERRVAVPSNNKP